MIRVAVEVLEDTALSRRVVRAESISHAVDIARGDIPGRDVRVVFPIDADGFFEPGRATGADAARTDGVPGARPPRARTLAGGRRGGAGVHERRTAGRGDV